MTVRIDREIDIKKDHLVFTRHKDGTLRSFSWHSAEKTNAKTMKDAKESIGATIQAIRDAGEYLNDAERILDKIEGVD